MMIKILLMACLSFRLLPVLTLFLVSLPTAFAEMRALPPQFAASLTQQLLEQSDHSGAPDALQFLQENCFRNEGFSENTSEMISSEMETRPTGEVLLSFSCQNHADRLLQVDLLMTADRSELIGIQYSAFQIAKASLIKKIDAAVEAGDWLTRPFPLLSPGGPRSVVRRHDFRDLFDPNSPVHKLVRGSMITLSVATSGFLAYAAAEKVFQASMRSKHDKSKHAFVGAIISALGTGFGTEVLGRSRLESALLGVVTSAVVGVAKEFWDSKGSGTVERNDALATAFGGVFGAGAGLTFSIQF
jgi:uncharacterized protein YfiM (DUF2279 family)